MAKVVPDPLLIGAHTSAQGGVHNALLIGKEIGATTIQLFTSNQRTWRSKPISDEEVALWHLALKETNIKKVMSHNSYLINLGSCKKEILEKSRLAFQEEIQRCHQLNISFLNFHPGSATESSEEECLETIIKSLFKMEKLCSKGTTRLLFETTAGQGSNVGYSFEQLGYLIARLKDRLPVGVCVDTCHIFAAGYDIRSQEGWEATLKEFNQKAGLKYLFAMHINDSVHPLGSRKDRHASLGEGKIGLKGFKAMMQHPKLLQLPKYLETPLGPKLWIDEIKLLRKFAK
ncbi:MAG: deoxyribonuclease IV [Chlamydiae bacterium RIFCSPLOWO2_02_FULL_49_12]|nr:MAG: deoxyribonuclease IV [Chlamydiae bacterium RIFCSPLOWO2_02_FULL_49_12]